MPLSEENRRLVEAVYGRDNCSTILRMLSARGFTLDRLLNAARAEERAKAQALGGGKEDGPSRDLSPSITAVTSGQSEAKRPIYRHVTRGTEYEVLGMGVLQTDEPLSDMATVVIYQEASGMLWARNRPEFFDGRFERLSSESGLSGRQGSEANTSAGTEALDEH